jgi:transcriptional regulator with XRE-family HTH domain
MVFVMTEQLSEIGRRLSALRDSMDIQTREIAQKLNVGEDDYIAYERGERDFSFSFLYNAANALGVDVVDIISGESPKLTMCCLVRNGGGYDITRREAYDYKHLAFTFRDKKSEPFMVTVEPKDGALTLHSHEGQEFVYIVRGRIEFQHGDTVYELGEGDSVYFDSSVGHAMKASGGNASKFLAVVIK